jgi:hypothetical protein
MDSGERGFQGGFGHLLVVVIGDGTFFYNLARLVENADGVFLVPEIEANGDGRNFTFRVGGSVSRRASAASCLLI